VTHAILVQLANSGVNSLRLPVGDWMYEPYGPYVGCTAGSAEKVDWLVSAAEGLGLTVLLDIHGVKGSQNGFDNSGRAGSVEWTSLGSTQAIGGE
jgi:glucan 1,3-beta-glucosidase